MSGSCVGVNIRSKRQATSGSSCLCRADRIVCHGRIAFVSRRWPISGHPRWGDGANRVSGHVSGREDEQDARPDVTQPRAYEATFAGPGGRMLRAEWDDCGTGTVAAQR